jgi:hypothetical protein
MIGVHDNLKTARRPYSLAVHRCAHILKPMKVASIGSFVVLSRWSLKSAHILMNASFSADLTDWK